MRCFWCHNTGKDYEFPMMSCRYCGGMEPSCCDGPIGDPFEEPTEPWESNDDESEDGHTE